MTNLTETAVWESGVYQIEETDRVQGGESGVTNTPLRQLANRTSYLKQYKADLESPIFTGLPKVPNVTAGANNTQIANTAYVKAAIDALKGDVPSNLDTLAEIATALGLKAPLDGPTFTGNPAAPTQPAGNNTTRIATTEFVTTAISSTKNGITDASSAAAGKVGEVLTAVTGTPVSLTSAAAANAISLTLTPGDWEINGMVRFNPSAAALSQISGSWNTTSGTFAGFPDNTQIQGITNGATCQVPMPHRRYNVSTNTTVYLVALAAFASGTCTVQGYIEARRIR